MDLSFLIYGHFYSFASFKLFAASNIYGTKTENELFILPVFNI